MFLELQDITKYFGGLCVLSDVSFNVDEGEIVGLIGPNGAGKTTLFNIISGIYRPNDGLIRYHGRDLVGLKPHQVCRSGIARTFQLVRIIPSMTVLENVLVGAIFGSKGGRKQALGEALGSLKTLKMLEKKDRITAHLTYSDKRLLEIARAVASKPQLALLDEPLAGLNPTETEELMVVIRELREISGISILWIEHKIDAILNLCDRVVVLDYGKKIAEGEPVDIVKNEKVVEAYLGEPLT